MEEQLYLQLHEKYIKNDNNKTKTITSFISAIAAAQVYMVEDGTPMAIDERPAMGDIQTSRKGDVNQDGVIDAADAVSLINSFLSGSSNISLAIGDMNDDGVISITDAVIIIDSCLKAE